MNTAQHSSPRRARRPRWLWCALALAVTGCFDFEQEIYLKDDGSGRAVIQYAALQSFIEASQFIKFMNISGRDLVMNKEAIADHMGGREGLKVTNLQLWGHEDERYVKVFLDFDHVSRLDERNLSYSWRVEGAHKVFRIVLDKDYKGAKPGAMQDALAAGLNENGFSFRVNLPRRIVDSNAKTVEWSVAEWFVPLGYFLDPNTKTRVLYAKVEATTMERVEAWFKDLLPAD